MFSMGSLEDFNISSFHEDASSPSSDWRVHADDVDSVYLEKCLPMTHVMPPWLSPRDCDAVLDTVTCRDISQSLRGIAYQPTVYMDQYRFPPCCVNSSQGFSSSATDSPNVGRGVSGELPATARAALCFSDKEVDDSYALLTQTNNNMSNRNLSVHRCSTSKMLAQ